MLFLLLITSYKVNMDSLISVIVPVYNAETSIRRCVDSLLEQTYTKIEIILIDDGSLDSSGAICDEYARNHSNIRVTHKENGGPASARDYGIEMASGEYIGFVDSDDYVYPEMYEHLWSALRTAGTELAICGFDCVNSDESIVEDYAAYNPIQQGIFSAKELLPRIVQTNGWAYVVPWNKLYHRNLIDSSFFPIGKYYEDEYGIAQLLYRAKKIVCLSSSEYHYYYMRKGGQTESAAVITQLDALEALYHRCMFYHEHGLDELIYDNRTIILRELEKYYVCFEQRDSAVRFRLKQISDWYGEIPGRGLKETLRWYLLRIAPRLEKKLITLIHS